MYAVTDADRKAAEELRVLLADVSGFWHVPGDMGPICVAMARHREASERQLLGRTGQAESPAFVTSLEAGTREFPAVRREAPERRKQQTVTCRVSARF
jgi:hypothetical protein